MHTRLEILSIYTSVIHGLFIALLQGITIEPVEV